MNDTVSNQPVGACSRSEHTKCLDADGTCSCSCHPYRRGLTRRDFSSSGAGISDGVEIQQTSGESETPEHAEIRPALAESETDTTPVDPDKASVDDLERVAAWMGVPGHVLIEMQRSEFGGVGTAYKVGFNDGLKSTMANVDLSKMDAEQLYATMQEAFELMQRAVQRMRELP